VVPRSKIVKSLKYCFLEKSELDPGVTVTIAARYDVFMLTHPMMRNFVAMVEIIETTENWETSGSSAAGFLMGAG
jgi:hypothetical protein